MGSSLNQGPFVGPNLVRHPCKKDPKRDAILENYPNKKAHIQATRQPVIMLAAVNTVALTAAGHLVAPAAGSLGELNPIYRGVRFTVRLPRPRFKGGCDLCCFHGSFQDFNLHCQKACDSDCVVLLWQLI